MTTDDPTVHLPPRATWMWHRSLFNAGEPINVVTFFAHPVPEHPGKLETFACVCLARFRDGGFRCGLSREKDGSYRWWSDDREGVADTWEEAWGELPAMVTHPDDCEDSRPELMAGARP